jgi:hypothetical protein
MARDVSWMSSAVGPPKKTVGKSAIIEKTATFSRDTSNIGRNWNNQNIKQQQQRR